MKIIDVTPGCWIISLATVVWLSAAPWAAETVVLKPSADVDLREDTPSANFGTASTIVSGGLGNLVDPPNPARRALVRFDLAGSIPEGAQIKSVTVTVKVVRQPSGPSNSDFVLRRVLRSWTENGATWLKSSSTGPDWSAPGAIGAADVAAASGSVFITGVGSHTFVSSPGLIAHVQQWLGEPASNFGWMLQSAQEDVLRTARHFGAREDAANAATLTIQYDVPPIGTAPPIDRIERDGDNVNLYFKAPAGGAYEVQFTDSLLAPDWKVLTTVTAKFQDLDAKVTDSILNSPQRFYRTRYAGAVD